MTLDSRWQGKRKLPSAYPIGLVDSTVVCATTLSAFHSNASSPVLRWGAPNLSWEGGRFWPRLTSALGEGLSVGSVASLSSFCCRPECTEIGPKCRGTCDHSKNSIWNHVISSNHQVTNASFVNSYHPPEQRACCGQKFQNDHRFLQNFQQCRNLHLCRKREALFQLKPHWNQGAFDVIHKHTGFEKKFDPPSPLAHSMMSLLQHKLV